MCEASPKTMYLNDYTPFGYHIEDVHLTFDLAPNATRVYSRIRFSTDLKSPNSTFFLHGEDLSLISAKINGEKVIPLLTKVGLTCAVPSEPFTWECEVQINPAANTSLEGLYLSNGMYCTQCEAEGFRKITYYADRPDVMSTFTVRINGLHNTLLSNGNLIKSGQGWAEWHDPWPKPSYLFALVAGELVTHRSTFTTIDGKNVELGIYVRPGDEDKCAFAMQALKDSMKWDENIYGRVYDLDVFNIVAVDDFNMGAMENKGLNIFNAAAVLASPETSTDMNFERIEGIIAHEYFHNWTGNRITCRDWFQLCLKEGLTVFRDSQFTADMRSAPVKRINDIIDLRAQQFPEDQGPLSHPVRPESFQEINNFYTATVYEKGAEVIRMLKILVGDTAYKKAVQNYFDRHDGQACTIEQWLACFETVLEDNTKSLSSNAFTAGDMPAFQRWYSQPGTPTVSIKMKQKDDLLTLDFTQSNAKSDGKPQIIPILWGLISSDGTELLDTQLFILKQNRDRLTVKSPPKSVPSILRGFSAPVILDHTPDNPFLLKYDTDPFNRWEAARSLARNSLISTITEGRGVDIAWLDGMATVLSDENLDPAYRSLMLGLPSQSELAADLHRLGHTPDPDNIWGAIDGLKQALSDNLATNLLKLYLDHQVTDHFIPNSNQAGVRSLGNAALSLLTRQDGGKQAQIQYDKADNMTQQLAALANLIRAGKGTAALTKFQKQWKHDRLVMDKWFSLQVTEASPDNAAGKAKTLTGHSAFNWKNPNRFRSIIGALSNHHAGFHNKIGSGYSLVAEWLIILDPINPQIAARMCSAFQTWKRYDGVRQSIIKNELDKIATTKNLSSDTTEMITRIRDL